MSETALNILTTISFLSLASYAIRMRNDAPQEAIKGLKRVSAGFLFASAFSLAWTIPVNGDATNIISGVMVALGLLIALGGLSSWRKAMLSWNAKAATSPGRDSISVVGETDLVKFVDACLSWANLSKEIGTPKVLAESFLKLLEQEIGVKVSLIVVSELYEKDVQFLSTEQVTKSSAPAVAKIASRGIDTHLLSRLCAKLTSANGSLIAGGKRFVVTEKVIGTRNNQRITLACENGSGSSSSMKTLTTGLSLFCSALERQAISRKFSQAEDSANLRLIVNKAFDQALRSNTKKDSGSMELRVTRVVFETLDKALNGLANDSKLISRDFMLVETSKDTNKMTVALSKTETNGKVSTGFFPCSRRVSFSDNSKPRQQSRIAYASLIRKLPVYDSRIERKRIAGIGLRSVIHGTLETSLTDSSQVRVVVVIGKRIAEGFGESQRNIVSKILCELQKQFGFVDTISVTPERGIVGDGFVDSQPVMRGEKPRSGELLWSESTEPRTPTLTI